MKSIERAVVGAIALTSGLWLAACEPVSETTRQPKPSESTVPATPDGGRAATISPENERSRVRAEAYADAIEGLSFDGDTIVVVEPTGLNDPNLAAACCDFGYDLLDINHRMLAIKAFADAVRHEPGHAAGYAGLGTALVRKDKIEEASAAFRTALELDPHLHDARFALATNAAREGAFDTAIAELERMVELAPDRGDAQERLAVWNYYAGDLPASRRHAERARALGHPVPPQLLALLDERAPNTAP